MRKTGAIVLGIYDLFLAMGAIWLGVQMITSSNGTFFADPYPDSWVSNLPFDSWVMPGILAIVIFGLGNIIAAVLSFKKEHNSSWYASAVMGAVFLFGLAFQYIAVGEMYIVTGPFLIIGIVQLCLSGYVFWSYRKGLKLNKRYS
ncbi:hypothetical protein FITA111629_09155 [Filibacter tadaridae]|uniref:Uncharacterized protein n=1 Tax=Filibacter tadaridae TaxID=2483811 RepID=A0A3P5WDN9_9BACL|nr:hypothetical protein [Filibacter tadaridae]VDC21663.1 hypothetical protein FILTAD_00667 [Filibacter tadaridae]